ncbi:MAG TPA: hypothetical protein VK563_00160 [Puia sp.]|nr:hypothetical protein [Puia sp.]
MQFSLNAEFENLKSPKIVLSDEAILISDTPAISYFIMMAMMVICTIFIFIADHRFENTFKIVVGLISIFFFMYLAFSLKRVKICLQEKIIYRTNFNPLENLLNFILQQPGKIAFSKI